MVREQIGQYDFKHIGENQEGMPPSPTGQMVNPTINKGRPPNRRPSGRRFFRAKN